MDYVFFYDEFNIYNKPSKEEIKSFIKENKLEKYSGEDIGNIIVKKLRLEKSDFDLINEVLDELEIL
jgi:hypothetical protein